MAEPLRISEGARILYIPVLQLRPNPAQPRRIFEPEGLRELAQSIAQHGILQPLTVRKIPGAYELIAGERRLRAARLAGLSEVPCILLQADEEETALLAMIENLQRKDLDYIEEARGMALLMSRFGLRQEQIAEKLGKSQSAVANKLRILQHSPVVLGKLREYGLTERHGRALLKLKSEEERLKLIALIKEKAMTVAQTEAYISLREQREERKALPAPKQGKRRFILRDLRLFLNSVNHSLTLVRDAGFDAYAQQEETDKEIILTIRLPKER
jgi:ParB family chromosome partitioning protein